MKDRIFALDIGTRSVTGIILQKQDQRYHMLDFFTLEHKDRSMRDGQIHNVVAVADTINQVKHHLSDKYGTLEKVYVAAAGRALMTTQATASVKLQDKPITTEETIRHLELSAVQAAQAKLAVEEQTANLSTYYCVGYSVLHYQIDNQQIGSLIDQRGDEATVEIIATFLPRVVVESLLAALTRANLQMEALTLEPIAAIHVLIPESMRRLNVVLVDIGAGTSDIAITNQGTIVAYGMVPVAGDEITEAVSDQYLLDFSIAEKTKRSIVNNGEAVVKDILGFESTINYDTFVNDISTAIDYLASQVAEEILRLNSHPPKAVMLVGGGSLTPNITSTIAEKLQLPVNRVAVRGIDNIDQLSSSENLPIGPEFVTPIGIAISANQHPVQYVSVSVNNSTIRLFELRKLTVGDCLIQAGIDIKKWYGKPGIASMITVNGKEITIPGQYGQPPEIQVNEFLSSVDMPITDGDQISIRKGEDGDSPYVTIEELLGDIRPIAIYVNDQLRPLYPIYKVNQQRQNKTYTLKDGDKIQWHQSCRVGEVIHTVSNENLSTEESFIVYVNKESIKFSVGTSIFVNNRRVDPGHKLRQGDRVHYVHTKEPTVKHLLDRLKKDYWYSIAIHFNKEIIQLSQPRYSIKGQQGLINQDTVLRHNDHIEIFEKEQPSFIFQDIFRYIDLDVTTMNGNFSILINQRPSGFTDPIHHGDRLEIIW
ncbi:cell division protein FtsA [Virgibacillus salexigens]|uniref:Cell division protein FtsA n=1 Tax=Virgibacillus massiliensis TaxID=1462526 RepID=A0A024QAH1_9BACI|nr:pilus assembly protein PilM [Virgibacillus massiliensis]CDQ39287.1 Cell division protein FtsA [Virgibacillus massiliensis]